MITDRELDLLRIAEQLKITVENDNLGILREGDLGGWFPEEKLILIKPGLNYINRMHTLAHELGHAIHNHDSGHHPRQERKADEYAATILINRTDYERVEKHTGGHIPWIAHELGVTVKLVEIWRDLMKRKPHHHAIRPTAPAK